MKVLDIFRLTMPERFLGKKFMIPENLQDYLWLAKRRKKILLSKKKGV